MTAFQKCEQLKIERQAATTERQDQIDTFIKRLEPSLTHDEAVFIVKKYETASA